MYGGHPLGLRPHGILQTLASQPTSVPQHSHLAIGVSIDAPWLGRQLSEFGVYGFGRETDELGGANELEGYGWVGEAKIVDGDGDGALEYLGNSAKLHNGGLLGDDRGG